MILRAQLLRHPWRTLEGLVDEQLLRTYQQVSRAERFLTATAAFICASS
jgi:hypothetical protein